MSTFLTMVLLTLFLFGVLAKMFKVTGKKAKQGCRKQFWIGRANVV